MENNAYLCSSINPSINPSKKNRDMKKYFKPRIETGIAAIYHISIGLETWCHFAHPVTIEKDKAEMVLAAKILHRHMFNQILQNE